MYGGVWLAVLYLQGGHLEGTHAKGIDINGGSKLTNSTIFGSHKMKGTMFNGFVLLLLADAMMNCIGHNGTNLDETVVLDENAITG